MSLTILPLLKTRVLKAHVEAVMNSINAVINEGEDLHTAESYRRIAEAVITATDSMTKYCVVLTEGAKDIYLYGPYATWAAASKAIASGSLGTKKEGSKGYILPLIPSPKREKKKK